MKKNLLFIALVLFLTSCQRSTSQTWEDVKTAGRYVQQGFDIICGNYQDSRQITSEQEFFTKENEEFIPLEEQDLYAQHTSCDDAIVQATDLKEQLPTFLSPKTVNFHSVHYNTDDHVIREKQDLIAIDKIANYLKKNPKIYLKVEGHCDKRASSAYNMALGMQRANHVRVLLIKKGVDFNRVYTVSYGKEKPIALGNDKLSYKKNRRAEFKFFTKD
jgi:peptidoglycan-associated lipoprotein